MNLPDPKKLKSLGQVLVLHQQQLDLIQTAFQRQQQFVNSIHQRAQQLETELAESQQAEWAEQPTTQLLQMANHCMKLIQTKIAQNEVELAEANQQLESIRADLRKKVSKKEALENFLSLQTQKLENHRRVVEQHLADERYLSRHFTN